MAFNGDILKRKLMKVFKTRVGILLHTLRMLGGCYLCGNERYQVNSAIISMFCAMLLDVKEVESMVEAIMAKLVWKH